MAKDQERIDQLLSKIEMLINKQELFYKEINHLKEEINDLKKTSAQMSPVANESQPIISEPVPEVIINEPIAAKNHGESFKKAQSQVFERATPRLKSDFEKFIGENLINKIGIGITVLGVAIGAKYAIDNELISPLTRIILGYLMGIGLLGFAFRLKPKYENFSAVLLSGAMAIMYFITYAAYAFYELFPQPMAFILMVVFTAFTVFAAIQYNKSVIAQIGLVGAYAVPFLLSEGSGKVAVLFSYMAIINVGILVVAFKKYWKSLYYSSFALTWLIFISWYLSAYRGNEHFVLSLVFMSIYFVIFYATYLSYKLIRRETYTKSDVVMLLLNSFIYFALGYDVLLSHEVGRDFQGFFALINAFIHAGVSMVIYRKQQADKNLFYMAVGLVMVFITITIPVQLDGNWVTLLWAGEAALLFWIGRTKNVPVYEKLSYPLMVLAFFSILHDWSYTYNGYYPYEQKDHVPFLLNVNFLTSLLFIAAFGLINWINHKVELAGEFSDKRGIYKILRYSIPAIFLVVLYKAFQVEITAYWDHLFAVSDVLVVQEMQIDEYYQQNYALEGFKYIWVLNYTMFFLSALAVVNIFKIKSKILSYINLGFNGLVIIVFLSKGLLILSDLREYYVDQTLSEYYSRGIFYVAIRYVTFAFVALLMVTTYTYIKSVFAKPDFKMVFDLMLHATILWVMSSELINWMDILAFSQSYKLGLSILWGLYALLLIVLGIVKRKKHLRFGAMALFGVTLVKLFFYDIASLNTIGKTIVFVSLGILLLIISFLYNKYKHIISGEIEN